MQVYFTSESVWQLCLGLAGLGLLWMWLKWTGRRLSEWWNADTVAEQIVKVRAELKKYNREPKIVTTRSGKRPNHVCVDLIPCTRAKDGAVSEHQERHPHAVSPNSSWNWYYVHEAALRTRKSQKVALRLLQEYLGKVKLEAL